MSKSTEYDTRWDAETGIQCTLCELKFICSLRNGLSRVHNTRTYK